MIHAFNTLVKPKQEQLERSLRIKKIEVKYTPSELKANYRSHGYSLELKRFNRTTLQFDPLGYISFRESRIA